MKPFYITTPIYYVNDVPHLGHAYTTIAADALARFHRMRGDDTRLLTGTDEHGQKVEEAARKRGLTPRALTDEVAPRFVETWRALDIANDDFIRTTEERHRKVVIDLWRRIAARGDLYLATYEGWYCVGCEAFYTESQLEKDDTGAWSCPTHRRPTEWLAKERSWFFAMSRYREALLEHIERHPHFIQPDAYRKEVVAFLQSGLRDLSVSRTRFDWGIPVPDPDPEGFAHVIYVWMDALTNYLSALGDEDAATRRYWPATCHLIGKDILRFHAVYWPCFLMSAGLPLPRTIYAHGWWTVRGEKISKSMPATRIAPVELARQLGDLGVDALRYYLLREVPLGYDGDFTFESLFARYHADLANDLGNLIGRSLTMVGKFADAAPPARDPARAAAEPHRALVEVAAAAVREAAAHFEGYSPSRALEATWQLVRGANRYIDQTQPWILARDPARRDELGHVLAELLGALWTLARLIAPVLPATARILRERLGDPTDERALTWPPADPLAAAPALTPRPPPGALFPRLDDQRQAAIVAAIVPEDARAAPPAPAPAPADAAPTATYEDFAKIELRVGLVKTAARVPKADKLLHLTVDLGEGRDRSIVAGIATRFAPEALLGRRVLVVANLAPRTLRGIRSEGMILAAGDEAILDLAGVGEDVPPGTPVR
jgi:methionyl-tRNA synthetase